MVLAECRAKHLKFTFCKSIEMQVLCFWCSTDSGGMPFQTFHVSNVLHFFVLAPHWTHLSIYMLVLPKKCLGSVCVGILHKIYEWELCFEYIWGPISKRFAGVNMFWRCLTTGFFKEHFQYIFICTHISQHIFYETFWDIFQKRFWKYNDSREMLQKSYRFLMKYCYEMSSRRCFVANIWNICIHTRNMFEEYNCGYSQKLTEEYLRWLAKTCSEKLLSEVPPIWPGEKNVWETCPKKCVYRFFRREMYSVFWVEI